MKFLISASGFPSFRAMTNVSKYIHFVEPNSNLDLSKAGPDTADVWICNGAEVTKELLDQWLDHPSSHPSSTPTPKSILVQDTTHIPRLQELSQGRLLAVEALPSEEKKDEQLKEAEEWEEESILRAAEMLYAHGRAHTSTQRISSATVVTNNQEGSKKKTTTVVLVGAGVVNLMTAERLLLAAEGRYSVRIVDAGPDPRTCSRSNADWTRLGVTHGGGNARMFTISEADNYNEKGKGSRLYRDMRPIFRRTARQGGWSVKDPRDFSAAELAWVAAFERVPPWLARGFREDVYAVNRAARALWREYVETTAPELFFGAEDAVGFRRDIVRLYAEDSALEAAVALNARLGSLLRGGGAAATARKEDFLAENPGLRAAAETGHLAGGITVDGFTVNVHLLAAKLIERITRLGGEFVWECEVTSLRRNALGEVTALQTSQGALLEADHYVLSPGTTSAGVALLRGTASENLVHGVLGIWLQIPNLEEPRVRHSLKIHRRGHLVEDINVTIARDPTTGEDILIFGGGYGYVGLDARPASDSAEMKALYDELEEVARIYFPRGYAAAKARGPEAMYPGGQCKFCVRPFTPTGLGLFEVVPTAREGGHLIITGGNNTGGFAQAPAVARAVERALRGEHDPIHVLFHPDRGKLAAGVTYKSRFPEQQQEGGVSLSRSLGAPQQEQEPLRLLVLCSDGPQHRYLRYRLDQAFPGYKCVVETSEGQVRQLLAKGRTADAWWQRCHGLRRRLAGHDRQRREYFDALVQPREYASPAPDLVVDSVNCREVWGATERWQPEVTIVAGTKYIGKKMIERCSGEGRLMLNLHTGHLPDYKGNHCVFFALLDGNLDKVSATLHQLTSQLDGGDILDVISPQVILPGDSEETLYARCVHLAIDRCVQRVEQFAWGKRLEFVPQEHDVGRTFRHRDRTPGREFLLWWKLRVGGLLRS